MSSHQSVPPSHPLQLTAEEKDRTVFKNQMPPLNLFLFAKKRIGKTKSHIYVYILRPFLFGFDFEVPRPRKCFKGFCLFCLIFVLFLFKIKLFTNFQFFGLDRYIQGTFIFFKQACPSFFPWILKVFHEILICRLLTKFSLLTLRKLHNYKLWFKVFSVFFLTGVFIFLCLWL